MTDTSRQTGRRVPLGGAGVTLIETMTILVLLGILTAAAFPYLNVDRLRIQSAMQAVGSHLLAAQRQAVQQQRNVVVSVDSAAGRLRIHSDANNNRVVDVGEQVRSGWLEEGVVFGRGAAGGVPGFTGAGAASFAGRQEGLPMIVFHRNGSASEEGVLYLTSARSALSGGDHLRHARAVRIERSTGRLTWFRYGGSAWAEEGGR